jgi:hypothetical protein
MKNVIAIIVLAFGLCLSAKADVWKWTDAYGETRYVDTMTPIYTWLDDNDKVHYSDHPEHENAVAVVLVWHSKGRLSDAQRTANEDSGNSSSPSQRSDIDPNESEGDRIERERAEAYYCKRATEIYDSYVNAPRLYKTGDDGEKVFLTDEESEATLSETKAKVSELCG